MVALDDSAAGWIKERRRWRYWLGESGRELDSWMVVALLVGRERHGWIEALVVD